MRIIIDIPKEFESDYKGDMFKDFFSRVLCDIQDGILCGNYEKETAEMLIKAFDESIPNCMDYRWIDEEGLQATEEAINIVNQVETEYNNGWIPCSERLPKDDSICIVTVEYPNNETVVDYGWFDRMGVCWYVGMQELRTSNVLAWQPLPEPYIPKEEPGWKESMMNHFTKGE